VINTIVDCILELDPVAKQRPRVFTDALGKTRAFTPDKTRNAESKIKIMVKKWMIENQQQPTDAPVFMRLGFFFHTDDEKKLKSRHTSHPDLDNLVKTVCDALNNIAYLDDKQIVHLTAQKEYWARPSSISIVISETIL